MEEELSLEQLEMIQEADKVREETERDNEEHKEWLGEFRMEEQCSRCLGVVGSSGCCQYKENHGDD